MPAIPATDIERVVVAMRLTAKHEDLRSDYAAGIAAGLTIAANILDDLITDDEPAEPSLTYQPGQIVRYHGELLQITDQVVGS